MLFFNNLSGDLNPVCDARVSTTFGGNGFIADCLGGSSDDVAVSCDCCVACCNVPDRNLSSCISFDDCCEEMFV